MIVNISEFRYSLLMTSWTSTKHFKPNQNLNDITKRVII